MFVFVSGFAETKISLKCNWNIKGDGKMKLCNMRDWNHRKQKKVKIFKKSSNLRVPWWGGGERWSLSTARVVWCPREGQGFICSRYSPATWPQPPESRYDGGEGGRGEHLAAENLTRWLSGESLMRRNSSSSARELEERVVCGWESPVEDTSPLSEIIKWKL